MKKYLILIIMLLFVNINCYAEGEATIKNIKVNGNSATCYDYSNCEIEVTSKDYVITFEKVDPNATVSREKIEGSFEGDTATEYLEVNNGENKVYYTFNLTKRILSSDISLLKLLINGKEQIVYQDRFVYNILVDYDVEKIEVSATTNDSNAKISGTLTYDFPLENSTQSFNFTVTAEDSSKKEYTVYAKRNNAPNTNISELKIQEIPELEFDPDIKEYELELLYQYNSLTLDYKLEDENSKLEVKNNENLKVGLNIIELVVTNEKATSTYTLNINRLEDVDINLANLSVLQINGYDEEELNFDPTVDKYDLYFDTIPSELIIRRETKENDAVVSISGNSDLKEGSVIEIKVDLQSPRVYRIYTLTVHTKEEVEDMDKDLIFIIMVILVIVMILLLILQIILDKKSKKKNKIKKEEQEKRIKNNKIYDFSNIEKEETKEVVKPEVKKEEEDIEII